MARDGRGLRLGVLGIVAVSLFATLFARLWYLQMMSPRAAQAGRADLPRPHGAAGADARPHRGPRGHVMADNRRVLSVTIDRAEIRGASHAASCSSPASPGPLQTPVEDLEARYTDVQYDPYLPLPLADDVPETTAIYLGERREDYPGVEVSEGWQRVYRYAPLASHVVGYMGAIPAETANAYKAKGYKLNERVGKAGIEQQYEDQLRGKPGQITYEVDARNRIIREVSRREPVPGQRHRALARPAAPAVRRADPAAGPAGGPHPLPVRQPHPVLRRPGLRGAGRLGGGGGPPQRPDPGHGHLPHLRQPLVRGGDLQQEDPGAVPRGRQAGAVRQPGRVQPVPDGLHLQAGVRPWPACRAGSSPPARRTTTRGSYQIPELRRRPSSSASSRTPAWPAARGRSRCPPRSRCRPTRTSTASAPSCSWPRTRPCRTWPGSSGSDPTAASTCRPRSRGRCPTRRSRSASPSATRR